MSHQVELMPAECDETAASVNREREKRVGLLRTDMHTMYDVPFQVLDSVPTSELRRIAKNKGGKYSLDLQAEANAILREREDPQDRDAVQTEV